MVKSCKLFLQNVLSEMFDEALNGILLENSEKVSFLEGTFL